MKRIYFFDVDNTIHSHKQQIIMPQTKKLLEELAKNPDYILAYATGRGPAKLYVLDQIKHLFTFGITVNGAVVTKKGERIFEKTISFEDVDHLVKDTMKRGLSMGMVGFKQEAVTFFDDHVNYALKGYTKMRPIVDPNFHFQNAVYQLWIFKSDQEELLEVVKSYPQFQTFLWHAGGIDLIYPDVSKDQAIKNIVKDYPDYQVICVGDGQNDIEMIKMADIGVAMGNTGYQALKDAASYVAPHIEEDRLYDFFKEKNLI